MKEKYFTRENIRDATQGLINEITAINPGKNEWAFNGKPALLVADMQNFFLMPESHACIPSAGAIIPNIKALVGVFMERGLPVIFTRHFNEEQVAGMMGKWWSDLLQKDSAGFGIFNEIEVPSSAILIDKQQYDAFTGTCLEACLKENGVSNLVISGVMANLCCETTLRSAFVKGFAAVMPVDATAAYNRHFHLSTFTNLSFGFAPLVTTDEIITLIE